VSRAPLRMRAVAEHVVVLGGSGGIGREVVAQLVARGHHVTAVARDAGRLQALTHRVTAAERLALLPRPIATEMDGALLARTLRGQGRPVNAVVSAMGGRIASGRLVDRTAPDLLRVLDQEVVAPFIAARHLLPLLAESRPEGGRYLLLSGPMGACAWSGYGHVSIAAAALQMLTRVVREEAKELPVCVQQLQVGRPVRSEANAACACPDWIGADEVACRVVALLERPETNIPVVELGTFAASRAGSFLNPRRAS
jgi:NAD(P)-dependent dehydrogenase (short-subunit alcohol dehydrogenase family)